MGMTGGTASKENAMSTERGLARVDERKEGERKEAEISERLNLVLV